jgi:PhnB protein
MGTDAPESMGLPSRQATSTLSPTRAPKPIVCFNALAAGGKIEMPLQEMFWGDYFGSLVDRFRIHWMFDCASKT